MKNEHKLSGEYPVGETKPVIDDALKKETRFAHIRFMKFESECGVFEAKYGMDSEEFSRRFESGELGDDPHWFDWYAVLKGKKLWEKKYNIFRGIKWRL